MTNTVISVLGLFALFVLITTYNIYVDHEDTNDTSYALIIDMNANIPEGTGDSDAIDIDTLEEDFLAAIANNPSVPGELDGHEYDLKGDRVRFFFYTTAPDDLLKVITPVLEEHLIFNGARLQIKEEGSQTILREEVINLK